MRALPPDRLPPYSPRARPPNTKPRVRARLAASGSARVNVSHETERLHLKHEIGRLTDRLETAEAQALDPGQMANVHFAHMKLRGPAPQWSARGGSGLLRGRLQNMVPPTVMASPAPI